MSEGAELAIVAVNGVLAAVRSAELRFVLVGVVELFDSVVSLVTLVPFGALRSS